MKQVAVTLIIDCDDDDLEPSKEWVKDIINQKLNDGTGYWVNILTISIMEDD